MQTREKVCQKQCHNLKSSETYNLSKSATNRSVRIESQRECYEYVKVEIICTNNNEKANIENAQREQKWKKEIKWVKEACCTSSISIPCPKFFSPAETRFCVNVETIKVSSNLSRTFLEVDFSLRISFWSFSLFISFSLPFSLALCVCAN